MRLHGFTRNNVKEQFGAYVTIPPGLYFYREIGAAIYTWLELREAVGFDFGKIPITAHYSTLEDFLHHEMPTFDMTEPTKEEYPDPKARAKVWDKKRAAARRKFYDDVKKLESAGLAMRDENGDLHLVMGDKGDEIKADRARRKTKRAVRRGEIPATETVTPEPRRAAPKALVISNTPEIDVTQEKVPDEVHPVKMYSPGEYSKAHPEMEKVAADNAHFTSEAKLRGRRHRHQRLEDETRRDEHRGGDRSYAAWVARQREEREAAITEAAKPFMGGLLDHAEEEEGPVENLGWDTEDISSDVDDDEMW